MAAGGIPDLIFALLCPEQKILDLLNFSYLSTTIFFFHLISCEGVCVVCALCVRCGSV